MGTGPSINERPITGVATQVLGTTTNNNAAAGRVGEYIESVVGTVAYPATGTWGDATLISLTPGDWDVTAIINQTINGATVTNNAMGISTTTGNSATGLVVGSNRVSFEPATAAYDANATIPAYRMSLAATTTVYLKFLSQFSVATPNTSGARLSARRVR